MMSSKVNEPSWRVQVFNLETGILSIEQVPVSKIVLPSKPVSQLTPIQVSRLTRIYHKVGYVIDPTLGKWLKDFTYEANPEQEIQIWEEIAIVFDRYNKTHQLTLTHKHEVVKKLIQLVGGEKLDDAVSRELLRLLKQERASKFFIRPYKPLAEQVSIDYKKVARVYQEYVSRHNLGIDDNKDELIAALSRLMDGQKPPGEIGRELLEICKYLKQQEQESGDEQDFNPDNIEDERQKSCRVVVTRPGQKKFKRQLIQAYGGRCSITGCSVEPVLEAAHIIPYLGAKTDHPSNGLLLRADIHNLFDSHYLTIHPETLKVETAPSLKGTCYADLAGRPLRIPFSKTDRPNLKALLKHYQTFSARWFS